MMIPRRRKGFTLLEMMMVLALVALLYVMITFVVIQVSHVTRRASLAAVRKRTVIQASERLRWQLRDLYLDPTTAATTANTTGAVNTTSKVDPRLTQRPTNFIGTPGASLYANTEGDGRDYIFFLTASPEKSRAVTEVGYHVQDSTNGQLDLMVRQFPLRTIGGFHNLSDTTDGPWRVLVSDIKVLTLDYSSDGITWQRQWDSTSIPHRIHVHLETGAEVFDYQVTPGIGSGRW